MSKWKSSKTHHFWRFQPKRISPFFSADLLTYYSTGQNLFFLHGMNGNSKSWENLFYSLSSSFRLCLKFLELALLFLTPLTLIWYFIHTTWQGFKKYFSARYSKLFAEYLIIIHVESALFIYTIYLIRLYSI